MNQLDIAGVSKCYGSRQALESLSFSVPPGQIFGLIGSNGAGKTTAMRIAVGVLAADSGEVRWRGRLAVPSDAARFGYMPEERGLYPKMTVAKQLVYLGRLRGMSAAQAREAMTGWTARLRVDALRDYRTESLSLGNRQRVQLAAALLHEPDLLVLDEPFSGLDPLAVDDMSAVLRDAARRGAAVVFSSHQLDLVERLCDLVGVVRGGKMVACGTLDALRLDAGAAPSLYLEVEKAPPDWPARCAAAAAWRRRNGGVLVQPRGGADANAVVRAALGYGVIREVSWYRPALTELFRELSEAGPAEAEAAGAGQEVRA